MLKEEIFSLIENLAIDQDKYNKFKEYVMEFTRGERCKKGVLEFVHDLYNSKTVEGLGELAIGLYTEKSWRNSDNLRYFIMTHPITEGYLTALTDQRYVLMTSIAKYITDTHDRIQESELEDKAERQVYLRRAVARLISVLETRPKIDLDTIDWSEVEPCEWTDYLCTTLDELCAPICDKRRIKEWADAWGDTQGLDQVQQLRSLRTYLNYLDTFYQY
uniref:Uncharacterized protein n=1 Tax=Pantoea phage Survivor TaxID=3232176 RepID=A0AAU8L0Q9_9CAUD